VVGPANDPETLLPESLGFGTSKPMLPDPSTAAASPTNVAVVFVNVAFPPLYFPFQTMVRLMLLFEGVAKPSQPPPLPFPPPVTLPCWMTSVTPAGALLTVQLENFPLTLKLLPPVVAVAGGVNVTLTVTPLQVTVPTAGPLKGGLFAAEAAVAPTSPTSDTGKTNATVNNKAFLGMDLRIPHPHVGPTRGSSAPHRQTVLPLPPGVFGGTSRAQSPNPFAPSGRSPDTSDNTLCGTKGADRDIRVVSPQDTRENGAYAPLVRAASPLRTCLGVHGMRRSVSVLIVSAVAVPAMLAALALPAFAKGRGHGPPTGKPVNVACTSLTGNASGTPSPSLGGCNQSAATGGSGTGTFTGGLTLSGKATVTWANGGTTAIHYSVSLPQSTGNKCAKVAAGDVEAIVHGAVSGGTPASGSPAVKGAVHAKACVATDGTLSLLPGSGPFRI
jgi:hypothetical protein